MDTRTQEKFLQEAVEILEDLKLTQLVDEFLNTESAKSVIKEETQKLNEKINYAIEIAPDFLKDTAEELSKSIVDCPSTFENSVKATFKVNIAKDFYSFLRYVSIDRSILLEAFSPSNEKLASQLKYMTEELRKTVFNDFMRELTSNFLTNNILADLYNNMEEILGKCDNGNN